MATQADLDRLYQAYYSGALSVKHGETSTTFRSRAELKAMIDELEAALNGGGAGARRTVAKFSRGF